MNTMVTFIAKMIMQQADKSTALGQEKYRAYFIKTKLYEKWRADVEAILITDGYEECIVVA